MTASGALTLRIVPGWIPPGTSKVNIVAVEVLSSWSCASASAWGCDS
eukprot:CAMPEP_0175522728 /NCGR_PEP_ID=MMETSP0096-20121207/17696_1 /TAXON_ID=311494 /ORGANISM="Alexandrium monilatum, Strain CCMP3105" /LENGTH=46 /DNA_ID= /DNA_START= /DNA_END= /DNA_ORIENTATION=